MYSGGAEHAGHPDRRLLGEPGDAEVRQQHVRRVAPSEQDVVGLDVPVQHAAAVGLGQRVEHADRDAHGLRGRQRLLGAQPLPQVGALDEVHDDREVLALDDEVADPDDVGVGEVEQDRPLLHEAADDGGVAGELRAQQLGGDVLAGALVQGDPHLAHRAGPEHVLQHVTAAERPAGRLHLLPSPPRPRRPAPPPSAGSADRAAARAAPALLVVLIVLVVPVALVVPARRSGRVRDSEPGQRRRRLLDRTPQARVLLAGLQDHDVVVPDDLGGPEVQRRAREARPGVDLQVLQGAEHLARARRCPPRRRRRPARAPRRGCGCRRRHRPVRRS